MDDHMDSFGALSKFKVENTEYKIYQLSALEKKGHVLSRLPYSLRILLENLLRHEDGVSVKTEDILAIANWNPVDLPHKEIAYMPARVLLQDFTGVPCIVDLASMRDAMAELGGNPEKINPFLPVELVIDHSVQVDAFGSDAALQINIDMEYQRNEERYEFLRWGQKAFKNFKVVPTNTGIVHQVNLEHLAPVVFINKEKGELYPDTLVGTDSHTTMINGLGVLGWGVGGIEAEAAMLGQSVSMLIPQVVGVKLTGQLQEGTNATDLVLTVAEMLRKHGVVDKFVEFFGQGLKHLTVADRATIGNMSPEYGATCAIFPVDQETLNYLRLTGRTSEQIKLVETYMKIQGLFHTDETPIAEYSSTLELDLSTVEPSIAGPKRPHDRIPLSKAKESFLKFFPVDFEHPKQPSSKSANLLKEMGEECLTDGSVVIAAITSGTNTSNPSVMVASGLLARNAVQKGLQPKPWVKTSLAPGSKVVTEYLEAAGLMEDLKKLGFDVVGYGCTTCIGNSGPLADDVSKIVQDEDFAVVSVLSGNRNFEGRINPDVKANYLMSPPLVVAYALAGTINIDLTKDPVGYDPTGNSVYLKDIWPTDQEITTTIQNHLKQEMFTSSYQDVFKGDKNWNALPIVESRQFNWNPNSTYVKKAPYFEKMFIDPPKELQDIQGLQVLACLGDSITTYHISPAGNIKLHSPAGEYLIENEVRPHLFNSYGSRRGNHETMVRGTFANVRLRNLLAPGTEGGYTTYVPNKEVMTIYDAAMKYQEEHIPLMVIAGKEYGSGSSRDWAAKGPLLLGVKVVLAESFERIHRSNLVGMGILPLQFLPNENLAKLGLTGHEIFEVTGLGEKFKNGNIIREHIKVKAKTAHSKKTFETIVRIDTPKEVDYYRHGGILPYVVRSLLKNK